MYINSYTEIVFRGNLTAVEIISKSLVAFSHIVLYYKLVGAKSGMFYF